MQAELLTVNPSNKPGSLMEQNDERCIFGRPSMVGVPACYWDRHTLGQEGKGCVILYGLFVPKLLVLLL